MRAVLICIREDDDLVVFERRDVEVLADAGADRGDDRAELLVLQHLVDALFLDVQRFSAQRQDRLEPAIAPLLGGAARAVAFDDEQLVFAVVPAGAARELADQRRIFELVLLARGGFCFSRGLAYLRGPDRFFRNDGCDVPVLEILQVRRELLGDHALDRGSRFGVAELGLRLPFKLDRAHL